MLTFLHFHLRFESSPAYTSSQHSLPFASLVQAFLGDEDGMICLCRCFHSAHLLLQFRLGRHGLDGLEALGVPVTVLGGLNWACCHTDNAGGLGPADALDNAGCLVNDQPDFCRSFYCLSPSSAFSTYESLSYPSQKISEILVVENLISRHDTLA